MKIKNTEFYTLITPEEKSILEFKNALNLKFDASKNEHILINFSENFNITPQEIELFLDTANDYRENGTSFVLIVKGIEIDDIPDEINAVPTLSEALDVLEMDAIERDLMNF
jgi:hypothetical protein